MNVQYIPSSNPRDGCSVRAVRLSPVAIPLLSPNTSASLAELHVYQQSVVFLPMHLSQV